MTIAPFRVAAVATWTVFLIAIVVAFRGSTPLGAQSVSHNPVVGNAAQKVQDGQQPFRFDTFGDQAFCGDTLKLHQAIEAASPRQQ